jgi:uncharacterized protein
VTALARLLVHRSRLVLIGTALLTLAAMSQMPRLAFNADVTSFLLEGSEAGRSLAVLQEKYGAADPIMVVLERRDGGRFTDRDGLVLLAAARDAFARREGVASVGSLVPERDPLLGVALGPAALERLPEAALAALVQGPGSDLLLGDDGRLALVVVLPAGDPIAVAREVQATPLPAGLGASFAGSPVVFAEVLGLLGWFLLAIPPIVLALLLTVFRLALGSLRAAILSIVPAVLGSLWTFGLIFGLGLRVDVVSVIVPIFVIVMGSADGLHLVSHFQRASSRALPRVDRVATALQEVGLPMVLTTLSTAAGFLSLLATDLRPIQHLGLFVAVGIVIAGVISLVTLPALLSHVELVPRRALAPSRLGATLVSVSSRRGAAVVLTVPLLVFTALYLPRLEVDPDQLFFFKAGHPARDAFARVEATFGGAAPLSGEFSLDRSLPLEPQLEAIRARSRSLERLPGVRRVVSVADLLDDVPALRRPALLSGEIVPPLGPMVAEDGLRFVLFPGPHTPADVQAWLAAARQAPEITVLTGTPVLFDGLSRAIVRAQGTSLALAFALVALMLLVTYRRVGTAVVALLPLALGVLTMLAFLAASGIQLHLMTAVAASIVIGVGIDYALHLIAAIEHARGEGPFAVERALERAGPAIVANALGVPVGLSALLLSPLAPHTHIAALMWVSMVTCAAAALVVIPVFYRESRGGTSSVPQVVP